MAEMTEKQWLSGVQSSIIKELTTHKAALPAGFNQERFALNTVTVISEMLKDKKKKTELCKLTFESMAVCLCKAAYLGLDYFNGECYAIPYGGELNFQTDYKGEIKMCKRFSRNPIKDIFAKVVRQDDFFTEEVDAGVQNVIYRPQPFSNKPMIGAFAIVVFKDGSMMYDTMSVEEIENVRNTYSKAKDSQAWKSSTGEMYKKTVLRRLCKLIDLDFDNMTVAFDYINRDDDLQKWQGSQITMIGFDELTHFSEKQFFYMLSRNRSVCGVKPYMRATCNPDADSWVADFISWWIDQDTGYPIKERSGKKRWFVRINETVMWAATRKEAVQIALDANIGEEEAETMPKFTGENI